MLMIIFRLKKTSQIKQFLQQNHMINLILSQTEIIVLINLQFQQLILKLNCLMAFDRTHNIQFFQNMKSQTQINLLPKTKPIHKKKILPFIIQKPPIENHIAYQKKGHWSEKERLKYAIFLQYFKAKFTQKNTKKRFCRVFKVMSDFIKTRTHNQCRSHHQKMQKQKYQVDTIINNITSKYHPRVFQQKYEKYTLQIQHLMIDQGKQYNSGFKIQKQSKKESEYIKEKPKVQKVQNSIKDIAKEEKNKKAYNFQIPEKIQINLDQEPIKITYEKIPVNNIDLRNTQISLTDRRSQDFPSLLERKDLMPKRNCQFDLNGNKSLDFDQNQVPFPPQFIKRPMQSPVDSIAYNSYIKNLQMRRAECLNKANYHYNQMKIQFQNAAQCQNIQFMMENERLSMVQPNRSMGYQDMSYKYGYLQQMNPQRYNWPQQMNRQFNNQKI